MSYRNLCFTVNNYTDAERLHILDHVMWSYVVVGEEIGEEGTSHLQGYGELKKRTKFTTVHNSIFNNRAHCEIRRGTQSEAIEYCKKDGLFEERGIKNNQGARNDLDVVRRMAVDEGMRNVTRHSNMQQIRVAEKFLTYNEDKRDWAPEIIWIYGPTGVGKSRHARELVNMDDCYVKNNGSKWWDGYDAHEYVILDDFRKSWFSFEDLLGLTDRYSYMVECKGGFRQMLAKVMIITCPWGPEEALRGINEDIGQLLRRITRIVPMVPEVEEVILEAPPLDI